jgi:hypothetical protein
MTKQEIVNELNKIIKATPAILANKNDEILYDLKINPTLISKKKIQVSIIYPNGNIGVINIKVNGLKEGNYDNKILEIYNAKKRYRNKAYEYEADFENIHFLDEENEKGFILEDSKLIGKVESIEYLKDKTKLNIRTLKDHIDVITPIYLNSKKNIDKFYLQELVTIRGIKEKLDDVGNMQLFIKSIKNIRKASNEL